MRRSRRFAQTVRFTLCLGLFFWATIATSQNQWTQQAWPTTVTATATKDLQLTTSDCYSPRLEIEEVREDSSAADVIRVNDALYATGRSLELTVVMRGTCSVVQTVEYDGVELILDGNPIEQSSNYWESVSRRAVGTNMEQVIRLHFANNGTGATKDVRITAYQALGGVRRSTDLTLSAVHAIDAPLKLQIPEETLRDAVAISLYETYGDSARLEIEDSPDSLNPSYGDCESPLDRDCLDVRVDDGDIHVSFQTDVFLSICTSRARISGRTQIDFDAMGGPGIEWVEGPDLELDVPLWCGGPPVAELFNLTAAWYFAGMLADTLDEAVEVDIPGCTETCGSFVNSTSYQNGVIDIELLAPPLRRRTVRVPYGRNPIDDPENYGLQRDANQIWILVPDGLAKICVGRTESGSGCRAYRIGSNGTVNWEDPNPRIPDPWPFGTAFFKQRLLARNAVNGVYRDHKDLPFFEFVNPGTPLAAEIEEGDNRRIYSGRSACRMAARPEARRVGFGVNDTAATNGGSNGRGDFFMHVMMITEGDIVADAVGELPPCLNLETANFEPPPPLRWDVTTVPDLVGTLGF